MLDRLFEFLTQFVEFFTFFTVVDQYEEAVILTFGVFKGRVLQPGFHWVWPFAIDDVLSDNVVTAPRNLDTQTLTTRDGKQIILGAMIRWNIRDIIKVLLKVEGAEEMLDDVTYGVIAKHVRKTDWSQINDDVFVEGIYKEVRERAFKFGIEVEEIQLTDLAQTRVYRLVGEPS